VLGSGRRLFPGAGSNLSAFDLVETTATGTGVRHVPAGREL